MRRFLGFTVFSLIFAAANGGIKVDCNSLQMGQYLCPDPRLDQIDPKTQQFYGCTKENSAKGKEIE